MDAQLTTRASSITAFPWENLPEVSRRDIEAYRLALEVFPGFSDVRETSAALTGLLATPCEITPLALAQGFLAPLHQGVVVELVLEGPDRESEHVLVECDLALVLTMISRVGQSSAPSLVTLTNESAPTPRICGATASLVMYLVRRGVGKTVALHLKGTAPAENALLAFCNDESGAEPIYASYTVVIGPEAFLARVWFRGSVDVRPEPPLRLANLGRAPLALKVVLAEEVLKTSEVAALTPGDVWILSPTPGRSVDAGGFEGPAILASPRNEVGLRATFVKGALVYDGEIVDLDVGIRLQGALMSASAPTAPADRVFGEVPVSVRVEIGAVELAAREWALLRKGDTLTLQKRLGDPVVLRVAGIEVARGELVNVEGEIGVRILEKYAGNSAGDSVDTQVVLP